MAEPDIDPVEPVPSGEGDPTVRWLLRTTLAIGVSLGLFTALAFTFLRSQRDDDAVVIGATRVTWDPTTDDALGEGKAASVEVIEDDGEFRVFVFDFEVLRAPSDSEFIEVWFVAIDGDEVIERVSIGQFDDIRTRLFSLPEGIDPRRFDAVEFSLEPDDGDEGYAGRTLLGGDIVWIVRPPG